MPQIACPNCKSRMTIRDEDLGKLVQCPGCKQQLQTQAVVSKPTSPVSKQVSQIKQTSRVQAGLPKESSGTKLSPQLKKPVLKKEPEPEEEDEESSDLEGENEADQEEGTGKISRKKRIWLGWEAGYKGISLASVGMVVYLVGAVLGGLGWTSYIFTQQDPLFYVALGISILSGLVFLVLDVWGRALLTQIPPEKVPNGPMIMTFSLIGFCLCYLMGGLSAAIPLAAIGVVLFLGVGYWTALFGYWLMSGGLNNRSLASFFLTHALSTISLNLVGGIFVAVLFLAMGVRPLDIQRMINGDENPKAVVALIGLILIGVGNAGLYLWAINLCFQLRALLGEKIGK